jgi:hypothetical protein
MKQHPEARAQHQSPHSQDFWPVRVKPVTDAADERILKRVNQP